MLKPLPEIIVDCLIADLGEEGEVADAYFFLPGCFVDCLFDNSIGRGLCIGAALCRTSGSFGNGLGYVSRNAGSEVYHFSSSTGGSDMTGEESKR